MDKHRTLCFLFLAVFSAGVLLRLLHLDVPKETPDESVYTLYAGEIAADGILAGTATLLASYNADPKFWVYPPPTRIGYHCLLGSIMRAVGRSDRMVAASVSCFFSVMTLLILIMTGLRFFSPWAALSGLMFLAVSPMDLAISRRAWPDSLMSFLASLLVYFGCRILADPKDKKFMILFALIGSYSLLVKESGLILFTLSAVCLLGCLAIQRKNLKPIATLLVFCAVGTEVSIWVLKSLMGEGVSSAWLVLRNVNASIVTNSYAIQNQDGPFYSFFEGLYWISPFTLMLACAGALIILAKRKPEHLWMVFFLASVIFVHTQMKYFKNLRYLSLIYTTYYLMAGAGLCAIADFFRSKTGGQLKRWVIPVCAALVLGFCYLDYKNFEYLFTKIRVQDLVIGPLRDHSIYSIVTTR